MSYSFSVAADTKAVAKQKIAAAFDEVVSTQAPHAKDRDAVVACGQAFVDVLAEPTEGKEIFVSIHGSLSWNHDDPDSILSAGFGISSALRAKAS